MNASDGYYTRSSRRGRPYGWIVVAALILLAAGLTTSRVLTQGLLGPSGGPRAGANPADLAVVVFNENDPLSRELADFYAGKRGIPSERVVGLKCLTDEEISREEYDNHIAAPLRQVFDARGWWKRSPDKPGEEPSSIVTSNQICYLVLIRGIPLRIKQTSNYPGDHCNEPSPLKDANGACVDSELTVLGGFTRAISGFLPNPYFRSYSRFPEAKRPPAMMLVGRLDAPTGSMVKRMIEDSLAVEKTGLWGRCYIDGRGMAAGSNPLAEGDVWMAKLANEIVPYTLPTVYDNQPAMFSQPFPMNEAALYFGWYSEQVAGPFARGGFKFQPGAVACHIHSFSATSVRDPFKWWVGPLIDKGADAVLGNVYEPYLSLTTHLDIFADHLLDGYTFAESAWAAQPGLSWMNTVVGDPLYRPALVWKNLEFDLDDPSGSAGGSSTAADGRAFAQGARTWHAKGPAAGAAALKKSAERLHSGRIYEGLGLLESAHGDAGRAAEAFEHAAKYYREPADRVRVAYEEIRCLANAGRKREAAAILASSRDQNASEPAAAVLDELKTLVAP